MRYDKDKIKQQLTIDDIASILADLGATDFLVAPTMIMSETICHNLPSEGSRKLYYYDNTKLFRCYTGCHEVFDIFELIVKAKLIQKNEEWSLPQAMFYIAEKFGIAPEVEAFGDTDIDDWEMIAYQMSLMEKLEKEGQSSIQLKVYDDLILNRLPFFPIENWEKEGITIDTMKKYGIKYYPKDCKIVLPHWDKSFNLIGIRGRTLIKQEAEMYGKYMPIKINQLMYSHPLSFNLYGLNFNKENIKKMKIAIVFEGEKSVMLYDSLYGSENNISVACCGSSISNYQMELLRELGVNEVIIAYDRQFMEIGDAEFETHVKNLKQLSKKYVNYFTISLLFDRYNKLGYKQSPIDKGKEVFEFLIQNRIVM